MIRVLLFLLFFVMLAADTLGLNLSLAPGISIKNAFLYLVTVGIIIDAALSRNKDIELLSIFVPYAVCLFYAGLTWLVVVLIIQYPTYSAVGSLINLKAGLADNLLICGIFFFGISNTRDAAWLMKAMLWTVAFTSLLAVIDALNWPDLGLMHEREDGRIGGPMDEANQYASFLVLFIPGVIALAFIEKGGRRQLAILGALCSILAVMMTVSRGGLLGLAGGALLGAFYLRRYISGRALALAAIIVTVTALAVGTILNFSGYGELLYHRVVEASSRADSFDLSSGRTAIWSRALRKMMSAPISLFTGFGWDAYRQFPDFSYAPHNSYLKVYFELGLIGLGALLLAFLNVLRTARSRLQLADSGTATMLMGFIFGVLGLLISVFFVDLASPWLFFWAYTGTAMRLAVRQVKET